MLADHTSRIATVTSSLTSKARRMAGEAQTTVTQLGVFENTIARDIGHRHFSGWAKVQALISAKLEKVFLELG